MTRLKREAIKRLNKIYTDERSDIREYYAEHPEQNRYGSEEMELDQNITEWSNTIDELKGARNFGWCLRLIKGVSA